MAYDGFGKSIVSKYQEVEMELAYRSGFLPSTIGYAFIGVGIGLVALLVTGIVLVS